MMFKGNNELELNQATMQEALEFWLEKEVLKERVTVSSVKMKNLGYDSTVAEVFVVSIRENAEDTSNAQT